MRTEAIHDRKAIDLPINARVAAAIVDDPYDGTKIAVVRSVRDDPLAWMHSRGWLDDAQFAAGRMWERIYESSEVGSVGAIDPTKEAVDGGRMRDPITDKQIKSFKMLAVADKVLGLDGCALVRAVLGRRMTISACAQQRGLTSGREINALSNKFRECLDELAEHWSFAGGKREAPNGRDDYSKTPGRTIRGSGR